ncbi:MAG: M28 family peptidase [bacterium]|nr:M28 family peptidase [bacterium]
MAIWLILTLGVAACGSSEARFDAERAWKDLETIVGFGPRVAGSEQLDELRDFLAAELKAVGLESVREPFSADTPEGKIEMENLYSDFLADPIDGAPAPMVILCTHIDTKRLGPKFVGANDAGSSTAAVLELARAIKRGGKRDVSYRFLFLDGEEAVRELWIDPDNTYGARYHAAKLKGSEGFDPKQYKCVLLDMIGDKDLKLTEEDNSTDWMMQAFFRAARDNGLGAHVGGRKQTLKDDHLRFLWNAGIESVDLIDFEYGPGNRYWHTNEDTLDKCSKESLDAIGRIVLAGLETVEARMLRGKKK